MPVTSDDFILSAEQILSTDQSEIVLRNAISRAYYGVFHCAKEYATKKKWPVYLGSTHSGLSLSFEQNKHLSEAYILRNLHNDRCNADYQIEMRISSQLATKNIAACKRLTLKLSDIDIS